MKIKRNSCYVQEISKLNVVSTEIAIAIHLCVSVCLSLQRWSLLPSEPTMSCPLPSHPPHSTSPSTPFSQPCLFPSSFSSVFLFYNFFHYNSLHYFVHLSFFHYYSSLLGSYAFFCSVSSSIDFVMPFKCSKFQMMFSTS